MTAALTDLDQDRDRLLRVSLSIALSATTPTEQARVRQADGTKTRDAPENAFGQAAIQGEKR
jgi:hypothetical protein